jgi:Na+-translocating ferredoxin:NAD+ oxidoreductase RnfD subunit
MTATRTAPTPSRHISVRGEQIPVVLPNRRDPRLKLSTIVITIHVLGQTLLDFKVSIAQILISMAVCGLIEGVITFRNTRMLMWPASGVLTGSSIALILRASGTAHGDYWSLNGIQFFVLAGVVSLLSKHLIRPTGRHLFNPSNIGIVWCLLVVGPNHVFAQYLWWGPSILGQVLSYVVILFGAVWVLRAVKMIPMAVSFMVTFAVLTGLFALGGREFIAIWHEGPIGGMQYWVNVALSAEVLVFVFFMISDPQTAPKAPEARILYGALVAAVAAAMIYFQQTEFGIKVSILSSLTVVCAVVPLLESAIRRRRQGAEAAGPVPPAPRAPAVGRPVGIAALRRPAVVAALIVAVAAPIDTVLLHGNKQVILIEQGQVGKANAQ